MKEPLVPRERPIVTAHEAHPSPGEVRRGEGLRYVVGVRFYRRMKVQRVYPLMVNVRPVGDHLQKIKSHIPSVEFRPVIPGAQVTPSHYEGERAGTTPAFQVTPLARGKLADARLEVYSHGRLVQEIPLRMKGTRQRLTWILLFLTILLPACLYYFTRHVDLSSFGAAAQRVPVAAQAPAEPEEQSVKESDLDAKQREQFMKSLKTPPTPKKSEGTSTKKDAASESSAKTNEASAPEVKRVFAPLKTKGPIEREAVNVLPDFGSAEFLETKWEPSKWIAGQLQEAYDWIYNSRNDYLAFFVGLALLCLTLLSWFWRAARRSSRRGQPIALGA